MIKRSKPVDAPIYTKQATCKCGTRTFATRCPTCGANEWELYGPCGRGGCYYCNGAEVITREGCELGKCDDCLGIAEICPLRTEDIRASKDKES